MLSILYNIILQITAIIALVSIGGLCTQIFVKHAKGVFALALSIIFGVMYYAIIGLILVAISQILGSDSWKLLRFISIIIILLSIIIPIILSSKNNWNFSYKNLGFHTWKKPVIFWAILSTLSFCATQVHVNFPENLIDGPYVIKNHNLNVKIQLINGNLPADNLIPFLVTEYLAKGISFKDEHPILPGQEVSNRPILMSLTALPFRLAYVSSTKQIGTLGTFRYVGQNWPDVTKLSKDKFYSRFLLIGIVLNSSIVVAFFLFISAFKLEKLENYLIALFILNPYTISQCMFIWPKFLAAFFVLIALYSIREKHSPFLVGLAISLAYLSHPYALIFIGCIFLYYACEIFIDKSQSVSTVIKFLIPFTICYILWVLWTRFYLGFHSDLVEQNLMFDMGVKNFFWVRIVNFYNLLSPRIFSNYPISGDNLFKMSILTIPSMIGILLFIQSYISVFQSMKNHTKFITFGMIIPTVLIVTIFSYVAAPSLHGIQVIFVLLFIFIGVFYSERSENQIIAFKFIAILQLLINCASIYPYMHKIGVFN
jgi:hypothetical protein